MAPTPSSGNRHKRTYNLSGIRHEQPYSYDHQLPRPSTLYSRARKTKPTSVQYQSSTGEPSLLNTEQPARYPRRQDSKPNTNGTTVRGTEKGLPKQGSLSDQRDRFETLMEEGSETEMRNYNISENKAKKLVARVLQRAAQSKIDTV